MPQAKKTRTKTKETNTRSDVMSDWTQLDPKALIEMQRKIAAATFDGLLHTQQQARKLTEENLQQATRQMDSWFKPTRQATEEMTAAGFDLGQRALEVSRDEVERWYDTVLPN